METRTTRVETSLEHVHEDIKSLRNDIKDIRRSQRSDFHITWAGMVGVCTMIAKGFHWF